MLCYGARLSEPFVPYTQQKGTVITMKENQEKKSRLSGLGATLQLGNKPLWKERVSYFFVNLGNIPIMTMVNAYLSIFYTDTLGMDAKVVGTMFLIARVFDGVNDPFIGYFIDRAPNSKFGKFRRILIVGTIICTLNYAVVWMGPAYVSDSMKVMVAYISYMLLGVTFPVMDISLNSMLPVMTNDMEERNFLAMLKNFAYGLGGGLNLIAPIVFAKFNSSVKGYNIMNLLAMGIILSCSLGGITGIHQRVEPLKDAGYKAKDVLRIIEADYRFLHRRTHCSDWTCVRCNVESILCNARARLDRKAHDYEYGRNCRRPRLIACRSAREEDWKAQDLCLRNDRHGDRLPRSSCCGQRQNERSCRRLHLKRNLQLRNKLCTAFVLFDSG